MTGASDSRQIDRLVDGELSNDERAELLRRLDAEPDGWKRCAVAFLEAQCWKRSAGNLLGSAREPGVPIATSVPRTIPLVKVSRLSPLVRTALAATLLLAAFAAGYNSPRPGATEPPMSAGPFDAPATRLAKAAAESTSTLEEVSPRVFMAELKLPAKGEGAPTTLCVPVLSAPGLDERALEVRPAELPAEIRGRAERLGYRVEQRRRFVSMVLTDGRRVAIPVDDLEFTFVGQTAF